MSDFEWNEAHSVHLPEVDAEHRDVFRLARQLKRSLKGGAPAADIEEKLQALQESFAEHFGHEERLMRNAQYPQFAWHKAQHDAARKRLRQFVARMRAGDTEAGMEYVDFLSRWLRDHMAVADNMMGASIRNYYRTHAA